MLKSKRFLVTLVSMIIFVIGTFWFKVDPVALAGGIGIILAPYIAGQSYRSSFPEKNNLINTEK